MPSYVVRCGLFRTLHVMQSQQEVARGTRVISRTNRGLELGEVLCEATESVLAQMDSPPSGSILRLVSASDETDLARIAAKAEDDCKTCLRAIQDFQLPMDLVDVERIFGGERIVVYYLSEDRIDFRELVKRLAADFQTRIEMRQIGVRDEAKLLADYGDCGKPVCCNSHLVKMPPVSMKMAKLQKATLDPNKISGRCGRLKCCLRYEYDTYDDIRRSLPKIGAQILTADGRGKVLSHELLSRQMLVSMEDDRRIIVRAEEVLSVLSGSQRPEQQNLKKSEDTKLPESDDDA
jgi:cell fate regulator YaaT (PSP1 superfamily)